VSRAVLDASELAVLFKESGDKAAKGYLSDSLLSAVILSEVVTNVVDAGMMLEEAHRMLAGFPCEIVPFDGEHAYLTGSLRAGTRRFGLSLGDRA
jgi:PIN domain nuclease of toxin-antitoxin system